MNKKKLNIRFWICLLIFLAAVAAGVIYRTEQGKKEDAYEKLAEEVTQEPISEEEPEPEEEKEEEKAEIPVDFETLKEENPDIYAWIRIPDTGIDYPILQNAEDDDYYLDHNLDGSEGRPGAIYTQYSYNSGCFADNVTVIYGHNMRDNSMFGSLSDYLDEDFRNHHSEIQIYTPEQILTYRVVCTVTYDNRHILANYNCSEAYGYEKFLNSLQTERLIPTWLEEPFPVTTEDKMIILSTCNGNSDQRFLVGAVLIDEE